LGWFKFALAIQGPNHSIDATVQKEDRRATILPTLLNAKDSFVLKLLIANFDGQITPDARIEGVELKPRPEFSDSKWTPIIVTVLKSLPVVGAGLGSAELGIPRESFHNDYQSSK
jgi:hypothetical protein